MTLLKMGVLVSYSLEGVHVRIREGREWGAGVLGMRQGVGGAKEGRERLTLIM